MIVRRSKSHLQLRLDPAFDGGRAGSGYRQDGVGPAGLGSDYAFQKVGARYYDPIGCFLTRDTDLSQSPYAYCNGDPVNCTDPSGHLSAVNIASGGIAISGMEDGSENAPVDTSGDNKSSSGGGTFKTDTGTVTVDSSGKITYAQNGESVGISTNKGLNVTEGGQVDLGHFQVTFQGGHNFSTGMNSAQLGGIYSTGGFKLGLSNQNGGEFTLSIGLKF